MIRNLSKSELERRIALLGRAVERFPGMREAIVRAFALEARAR